MQVRVGVAYAYTYLRWFLNDFAVCLSERTRRVVLRSLLDRVRRLLIPVLDSRRSTCVVAATAVAAYPISQ